MKSRLFLAVTLAISVPAQRPDTGDAPRSAGELLSAQLQKAAALSSGAFEASWRWPRSVPAQAARGGAVVRVLAAPRGAKNVVERASGRFAGDVFAVRLEREDPIELVQAGRFTVTREDGGAWRLSGGRPNPGFVPDPQLILRMLAHDQLTVLDRSIGERDGAAVEFVAATLSGEQVERLTEGGAMQMPSPLTRNIQRYVRAGRMKPSEVPLTVVDVAFEFDVATRRLARLELRALNEPIDLRALMRRAGGRGDPADEPEVDEQPRQLPPPTEFAKGMPVRDTEGFEQRTFELRLTRHDAVDPIELDEAQRQLLGR